MGNLTRVTRDQPSHSKLQSITAVVKSADKHLAVTIQLALILILINRLQLIDVPAFYSGFAPLLFGGFIIHQFLPLPWRLPFFSLLSITGIFIVLGAVQSLWLVGVGLLLIMLCHLPVPYKARLALLALLGLGLGLGRAGIIPVPWSTGIWPIIGAMFMFRLLLYLHYLRHQNQTNNAWATLSYFFLLPNVLFPLFPIVDYGAFHRNYYKDDPFKIYQRGLQWMALGVIQLIVYRYINLYLTLAPVEVTNIANLIQYFVTDFLLILRLVGQFQLVIGILLLFGFDLPRVFNNFLLSDSFSDFWRRVNIYWKDFMTKLFFNPVYFRFRKQGPTIPLVIGTVVVFVISWFLHSYQWFWLRGSFLLTLPDMSFWAILGFLALINSLREQKRRSKPGLLGQGLRIVGTFAVISIMWSLWTSPTFTDWFALLTLTEPWQVESSDLLRLTTILIPLLIGLLITLLGRRFERHQTIESWLEKLKNTSFRPYLNATAVAATVLFLIAIFDPAVYRRFGNDAARTMISLTSPALSRRDDLLLTRGYYEELANVNRFNTELWQLYQEQPPDWKSLAGVRAINLRDDLLEYDLLPNLEIYYKRAAFSTNNWGMRDKEYTQLVPENTCRMALLGSSIVMGAGVTDREVFEWRLEERLNDDSRLTKHVEILNFASGGYFPLHRMAVLEEKAMAFNPDVVIYVSHPRNELTSDYIVELYRKNITFPEEIEQILEATGIQESMADIVIQKRIQTVIDDITLTIYRRIADQSKANGILPIMVLVPRVDGEEADDVRQVIQLGQEAGFIVIDLTDVYAGYEPSAIWVAAWDHHPNSTGHVLIAERLYQEIQTNPELVSMCSQ